MRCCSIGSDFLFFTVIVADLQAYLKHHQIHFASNTRKVDLMKLVQETIKKSQVPDCALCVAILSDYYVQLKKRSSEVLNERSDSPTGELADATCTKG